jgi:hypothetical protein
MRTGPPLVARNALRIRRDEMLAPAESANVRSRRKLMEGFYRRLPGLTLNRHKREDFAAMHRRALIVQMMC